jgi:hypothetical protein
MTIPALFRVWALRLRPRAPCITLTKHFKAVAWEVRRIAPSPSLAEPKRVRNGRFPAGWRAAEPSPHPRPRENGLTHLADTSITNLAVALVSFRA